jgi:carbonic anhydrase
LALTGDTKEIHVNIRVTTFKKKLNFIQRVLVIAPETWQIKYPQARGKHQSPIDIQTKDADYNADLSARQLTFSYASDCFQNIVNTGAGFMVNPSNDAVSSTTSYLQPATKK